MALHQAKIVLANLGSGTVEIDGEPVNGVRGIKLDSTAGQVPRLTIEFLLGEVELEGEMEITVPAKTAWALGKLGWTPPQDL